MLNATGKHPSVPMKPRSVPAPMALKDSGDPQKRALAQSARAGLPPAPPGGKVNILA